VELWVFLDDGVFDKETVEYRWNACINPWMDGWIEERKTHMMS
jgi:hypothetical protein